MKYHVFTNWFWKFSSLRETGSWIIITFNCPIQIKKIFQKTFRVWYGCQSNLLLGVDIEKKSQSTKTSYGPSRGQTMNGIIINSWSSSSFTSSLLVSNVLSSSCMTIVSSSSLSSICKLQTIINMCLWIYCFGFFSFLCSFLSGIVGCCWSCFIWWYFEVVFAFMLCYVAMYALKSIKLHEISLLKLRRHSCLYKSSLICTWRHYSRQVCTSEAAKIWKENIWITFFYAIASVEVVCLSVSCHNANLRLISYDANWNWQLTNQKRETAVILSINQWESRWIF